MASHPSPVSPAHGDGVTGKGGNKERKGECCRGRSGGGGGGGGGGVTINEL